MPLAPRMPLSPRLLLRERRKRKAENKVRE